MDASIFGAKQSFQLLAYFNMYHPFWNVTLSTVVSTWGVMALLFFSLFFVKKILLCQSSYIRLCLVESIRAIMDMVTQSLGHFEYKHFSLIAAFFFFILACNIVGVIPFFHEPTTDLNTTFALGAIGLLYREFFAIKEHGFYNYTKEFFQPLFVMFPLHVMGKFSSLISISFRLFGNIIGGSFISQMWFPMVLQSKWIAIANFLGIGLIINLFFGIFEGIIQAFVFAMLSLTYLSLAISHEDEENDFEKAAK